MIRGHQLGIWRAMMWWNILNSCDTSLSFLEVRNKQVVLTYCFHTIRLEVKNPPKLFSFYIYLYFPRNYNISLSCYFFKLITVITIPDKITMVCSICTFSKYLQQKNYFVKEFQCYYWKRCYSLITCSVIFKYWILLLEYECFFRVVITPFQFST